MIDGKSFILGACSTASFVLIVLYVWFRQYIRWVKETRQGVSNEAR
jgi:hypothetical protein